MATALLVASLFFGGDAYAQAPAPPNPAPSPEAAAAPGTPTFKPEELEQMLAPVALYPDALLAQVLMASTYPLEVVQADRWLKRPEHKDLKGEALAQALEQEKWDPSVKSLAPFPQILNLMSDQLDWSQRLGDAVLAQRKDVMAAVQRLRKRAEAAGTLTSTEQQTVVVEQGQEQAVAISPADPEKVYVPVYNPTVAYGAWPYPSYPPPYYPPPPAYAPFGTALMSGIGFGVGVAVVGSIWGWGDCDWRGNDINVNTNTYNTINRANIEAGRATRLSSSAGGNSWQFQPAHRGGVAYRDEASRRTYQRPIAGTTAARQQYRGYANTPARSSAMAQSRRPAQETAQGQRPAFRGESRQSSLSRQAPSPRRSPSAFSSMSSGPVVAAQSSRGQASRQASAARSAPSPAARAASPAAPRAAPGGGGGGRGGGGRR